MFKRIVKAHIACVLASFALAAHAVEVLAGTASFVSLTPCIPSGTICNPQFPSVQRIWDAEPNGAFASATATNTLYGISDSSVALSGTAGAPILKAKATSELGGRGGADAVAVQRYVYNGSDPTTRTFGGALSYVQSVPFPHDPVFPDRSTLLNAFIVLYAIPSATFNVGVTPAQIYNDLVSFPAGIMGAVQLGNASWQDYLSTTSGNANLGVTITLNPGDSVWVKTVLQVRAAGGGYSDASNTFITAWDNSADLVPAVVGIVPEPGTLVLMCLGIALGRQVWRKPQRTARAEASA